MLEWQLPPRSRGQQLKTSVRGDAVQPRAQRAPLLETGKTSPSAQQSFLQRIVGVRNRAEHAVAVGVELTPVRRYPPFELAFVDLGGHAAQASKPESVG